MKVIWTATALRDLNEITAYVLTHYPAIASDWIAAFALSQVASAAGQKAHGVRRTVRV